MGLNFARAYIGLQEFTGTDWGGKFLGVTKKHWSEAFFLAADDELLEAFSQLGEDLFTPDQVPEKLLNTLEKFVHQIHGGNRWTLFRSRNLRGNLPPTRATLVMRIFRANYAAAVDKSWKQWCPNLPAPEWVMAGR